MKKLGLVAALVLAGMASLPAQAIGTNTTTNNFTVTVNMTSACKISTSPTAMTFTYQALQATAAAAAGSFGVTCTNTLPYTAALDSYTVTDGTTNLIYTLDLGKTTKPLGAVGGIGTLLSAIGSGVEQIISIDGSMAGNQAGTCASATCTGTTTRTLTITY